MESKILTYLGLSKTESNNLGEKTKKFVKVLDGLQQVYAQSPDNTKKEKLAIVIVQMNRELMAYLKANRLGVYQGSPKTEQPQPEQPQKKKYSFSEYERAIYYVADKQSSQAGKLLTWGKQEVNKEFDTKEDIVEYVNLVVVGNDNLRIKGSLKITDFIWDFKGDNPITEIYVLVKKVNIKTSENIYYEDYLMANEEERKMWVEGDKTMELYLAKYTLSISEKKETQPQPQQPQPQQPQPQQPQQKTKEEKIAELKIVISGLKILARKNGDTDGKIKTTLTGLEILLRNLQR